jgi:hypothetical protein
MISRETELVERRKLINKLRTMSPNELAKEQDAAGDAMFSAEAPDQHWAVHTYINIVSYRSFGALDVPCKHRET